jgi:hypothetical protein
MLRTTTWIICAVVRTFVDFTVAAYISEERVAFIVRIDVSTAARGYTALCARRQKLQVMVTLDTSSCYRVKTLYLH